MPHSARSVEIIQPPAGSPTGMRVMNQRRPAV
jgi:hypothetical protein